MSPEVLKRIYGWIDRLILGLGREMRLSYLPPLMVYLAAGVSGLTGIVAMFFVTVQKCPFVTRKRT